MDWEMFDGPAEQSVKTPEPSSDDWALAGGSRARMGRRRPLVSDQSTVGAVMGRRIRRGRRIQIHRMETQAKIIGPPRWSSDIIPIRLFSSELSPFSIKVFVPLELEPGQDLNIFLGPACHGQSVYARVEWCRRHVVDSPLIQKVAFLYRAQVLFISKQGGAEQMQDFTANFLKSFELGP